MESTAFSKRGLPGIACWLAAYSICMSTCPAQQLETLLMLPNRPNRQDPPAYISSVGDRVAVSGDYVFLAGGPAGLRVYRLAGPGEARLVGQYETGGNTHSVRLDGTRVYAFSSQSGQSGPAVFDARAPAKLRRITSSDVPPEAWALRRADATQRRPADLNCVAAIVDNHLYIARDDVGVAVIEMEGRTEFLRPRPSDASPTGPIPAQALVAPAFNTAAPPFSISLSEVHMPLASREQDKVRWSARSGFGTGAGAGPDEVSVPERAEPLVTLMAAPRLAARYDGRTLRLTISGAAGQTIRVQRGAQIAGEWEDWQTIVAGDEPVELTDEAAAHADEVFYRAVSP